MTDKNRIKLIYLLFVLLISTHFTIAYITSTKSYINVVDYAQGNARTPFQYRALTAWIMHFIVDIPGFRGLTQGLPAPFAQAKTLV